MIGRIILVASSIRHVVLRRTFTPDHRLWLLFIVAMLVCVAASLRPTYIGEKSEAREGASRVNLQFGDFEGT
jgi:hypothetical protein